MMMPSYSPLAISSLLGSSVPYVDVLRLREAVELLDAFLAPHTAVLHSSERRARDVARAPVDPDVASRDLVGGAHRHRQVVGPDAGRQPERQGIGAAHDVVEIVERDGDQDRSKDLLAGKREVLALLQREKRGAN